MKPKKVLLVGADPDEAALVSQILSRAGHRLCEARDGSAAYDCVLKDTCELVISEFNLPGPNGLDLLKKIKSFNESLPVVMISGGADVQDAVAAMKMGARDFILKPLAPRMIEVLSAQLSNGLPATKPLNANDKYRIVTRNEKMNRLLDEARNVADSRASIFIQGESGTGKEFFARYIHRCSWRRNNPFVAVNCAALPENLLESELFGHEKGAFTGAVGRKKGKFELADHGTLLLDEISEMDYQLQSKLLRVLQEREVDRVGGVEPVPVDVRVIATSNRDIEQQINAEKFREDLYYRLNIIPFYLPPLRERGNDIPLLVDHFIAKYNRIEDKRVKGLTDEALDTLKQMPWKGNIRELENIVERSVLVCRDEWIKGTDLISGSARKAEKQQPGHGFPSGSLKEIEKKVIFQALDRTKGNRTHAAEILGISVRTLRNKLNEYREKMAASH